MAGSYRLLNQRLDSYNILNFRLSVPLLAYTNMLQASFYDDVDILR